MVEDNITPFVPIGTLHTMTLTQRHLNEAARALGRALWDYEVKILDEICTVQAKVNHKLTRKGHVTRTHSMDEVIGVFVSRVMKRDAQKLTDAIMSDHAGKKEKVYAELNRIANDGRAV